MSLELSHYGGDVLPAGSEIRIEHGGEAATLELETALEPNQSVYVSYPSDGGSPVLTRTKPDERTRTEIEGSYSVTISDPNGNPVHAFGFAVGSESSSGASDESS